MKVNRLFEIIYILLDKKTVTARELADRLEVSVRTIYRDIDALSAAKIPVYTTKGMGGGISILPDYVLNKSVLTDEEQNEILAGLQGLRAAGYPEIDSVLGKIGSLFNKADFNWIEVDFSSWGSRKDLDDYFYMLKSAILNNKVVQFDYYGARGEKTARVVEPFRLIFKDKNWYLQGYCRSRKDFRLFKLSRVVKLAVKDEIFDNRVVPDAKVADFWGDPVPNVEMTLKFCADIGYRVFDEFNIEGLTRSAQGDFIYKGFFPDDISTYTFFLSYGNALEILAPASCRQKLRGLLGGILKKYDNEPQN